ncbi:MAG TPA: ASPIC/UnbV domain-containing protein, partial [Vicinamibacteria bacterium]|nr:ASPIC/UnbV domain-containing protein [Vicinamibacteria bacterium]
VAERGGPVRILENDGERGPSLAVSLRDGRPGVGDGHGLGSKVVLRQGHAVQTRWIVSGGSFQGVSAPVAYFGLAGEGAATIEVTWPDGTVQKAERAGGGAVTIERR